MTQEERELREIRSQKTKRKLTVVVALLCVLVVAIIGIGLYLVKSSDPAPIEVTHSGLVEDAQDGSSDSSGSLSAISDGLPDLAALIGVDESAAIEAVGNGAETVSTEAIAEDDDSNADADTLVELSLSGIGEDENHPELYLTLDDDGTVIEAYYGVSLDLLGVAGSDFGVLVETSDFVSAVLSAAGVDTTGLEYTAPTEDEYQTLGEDSAGNEVVTEESYGFSGVIDDSGAAKNWEVTVSYDHSLSNMSGEATDIIRMVYVRIS